MDNSLKYYCFGCHLELHNGILPCPKCGCNKRVITKVFNEVITMRESFFKVKGMREGYKKFFYELIRRYKPSGDPKLPEGVFEERLIDKIADLYQQKVYKVKNGLVGRILHLDNEKLTKHTNN